MLGTNVAVVPVCKLYRPPLLVSVIRDLPHGNSFESKDERSTSLIGTSQIGPMVLDIVDRVPLILR